MKLIIISLLLLLSMSFVISTDKKEAYVLYDSKGNKSEYDHVLQKALNSDVILFGELHDNPIIHWLQLELTKDIFKTKKTELILGAEMFEADDQIALNEYLAGRISDKTLKDEVKLWNNFSTDYKPLLDFAKHNKLKFIATNIPRRYANMVYSKGTVILDSIDVDAKKWIAPLPLKYDANVKAYKEVFENSGGHGGENLPKSQAIKDATMSYFILKHWSTGKTFLHYNGAYHSNNHSAIEWYLKEQNPSLKVMVISASEQDEINKLEDDNNGLGDFIICTPTSLTKTYK